MAINVLTDRQCRALVCPPEQKILKAFDGHGLHLAVMPTGAKLWRMAYRFAGKPQTAAFGPYPRVTLGAARDRRDQLLGLLAAGQDPRAPRNLPPHQAQAPELPAMTLRQAMETYWAARTDVSDGYRRNAVRAFELHLVRLLDEPIGRIDRAALMQELRRMDAAGLHVYVRRVRMWAGLLFEWALERREETGVMANPAAEIRPQRAFGHSPVRPMAALSLAELPAFMHRLSLENQHLQSVQGCRLLALTWVRTQELRMMRWDEIEQDGALWRIPAGRMKRRVEHLVPLSRQAQEILARMRERAGTSPYVFPSDAGRRPDRPMSENAILYLIGRIGYEGRMTGHGWRSIASTWANESGRYPLDAIERQLAHAPRDRVRAAYNRAEYLAERRRMLQEWADWLDSLQHPAAQVEA